MGKHSRNKGARFEREVANALQEATGVECARELTETRAGNIGDVTTDLPLVVQAKCGKLPPIWKAVQEAEQAAGGTGKHPVAIVRRNGTNRHDPAVDLAVLPLADFLEIIGLMKHHGIW